MKNLPKRIGNEQPIRPSTFFLIMRPSFAESIIRQISFHFSAIVFVQRLSRPITFKVKSLFLINNSGLGLSAQGRGCGVQYVS